MRNARRTAPPPGPVGRAHRGPATVLFRFQARRVLRSAVLWGYVAGIYVATTAWGFSSLYATDSERRALLGAFGSNAGIAAIAGPARSIDTVAGFTAWKVLVALAIVLAVWGMLTATRVLRGEEEAGRWELFLGGALSPRAATAATLGGLATGLAALWSLSALIVAVAGLSSRISFSPGSALFLATAVTVSAALFMGVGALASQLAPNHHKANVLSAAVVGVSYGLRMVADSATGLTWLRWASPLGWIENLQVLTGSRWTAFVPALAFIALTWGASLHLAERRDLGGAFGGAQERDSSLFPRVPIYSPGARALLVRVCRPRFAGWTAAVGVLALVMGFVAQPAGRSLVQSPSVRHALARLGAPGAGAGTYLGVAFLMTAVLLSLAAASQLATARHEEASRRLDNLLVRTFSRTRWMALRVSSTVVMLVFEGLVAGFAAWIGMLGQHAGVGLSTTLAAGLNLVPPALATLGIGVLAMSLAPRATSALAYGLVAWSFLVVLVAEVVTSNHWVLDTSLFHHLAAAPAVAPDWGAAAAMSAVGVATSLVGTAVFARRDVVSD